MSKTIAPQLLQTLAKDSGIYSSYYSDLIKSIKPLQRHRSISQVRKTASVLQKQAHECKQFLVKMKIVSQKAVKLGLQQKQKQQVLKDFRIRNNQRKKQQAQLRSLHLQERLKKKQLIQELKREKQIQKKRALSQQLRQRQLSQSSYMREKAYRAQLQKRRKQEKADYLSMRFKEMTDKRNLIRRLKQQEAQENRAQYESAREANEVQRVLQAAQKRKKVGLQLQAFVGSIY